VGSGTRPGIGFPAALAVPGRVIHTGAMRRGVVLVGLACVLVGALLDRRGLGGWDLGSGLDSDLDRLTAATAAVLAAAGLLSLAPARYARVLAAIGAAATVVPGVLAVTGAVGSGLPGPSSGVLAVGSAVVVLGAAARAFETAGTGRAAVGGRARAPRVAAVVAVAVLVTTGAAWGAAVAVVEAPVRASTAAASTQAPVVLRASGAAWEWTAFDLVQDVRAAGAGVVVAGDDGVTALDGPTGAVRWEFARTGARVVDMVVSPDASTVALVHASPASDVAVLTALDALTGVRRWETVISRHAVLLVTDAVVAVAAYAPPAGDRPDDGRLVVEIDARDAGSGARTWTWATPPGCTGAPLASLALRRVVPVEAECPDGAVLHGLDERTGQDAWALPLRPPSAEVAGKPLRSTGAVLVVTGAGAQTLAVESASGRVVARIDREAGFPLPAADGRIQLMAGDPERVVATVEPATGAVVPLAPTCDSEAAVAVTAAAVLRLCRGERYHDLQVDAAAPVPLDLIAGEPLQGLDPLRDAFVVPAPGTVVVSAPSRSGTVIGLG
jgi:outer membrane protein assembly factor BamB